MKSMELQKLLLNEVAAILDDEEMTEKALRSIRRLRAKMSREQEKEEENLKPYTIEEIETRIERSEADIRAGRVSTSEEVFKRMEEKYPWLHK